MTGTCGPAPLGRGRPAADGDVALGLVHLLDLEFAAARHEGAGDGGLGAGELVDHGAGAVGPLLGEGLDGAGVAPGQEAVDVGDLGVEPVVRRRAEEDDGDVLAAEELADLGGELLDLPVGDGLGVAHAQVGEGLAGGLVDEGRAGDEGAEDVALAAFVGAHVGGVERGVEGLFVAEGGLLEHQRLEREEDEVLRLLALHHQLARGVEHDGELGALERERGVGRLHAPQRAHAGGDLPERLGLPGRQGVGEEGLIHAGSLEVWRFGGLVAGAPNFQASKLPNFRFTVWGARRSSRRWPAPGRRWRR